MSVEQWCNYCEDYHFGKCYPQQDITDNELDNEEDGGCSHPNMESTVRTDYCPDCGYSFYYPSAH